MNTSLPNPARPDLRYVAAVIALAIAMVAFAVLLYSLINILLVLFLGIIVAATLQPGHQWLAQWGVPKALAVLVFYAVFLVIVGALAVFVGPTLFDQLSNLAKDFPERYGQLVDGLRTSTNPMLQQVAGRLPTFTALTQRAVEVFPAAVNSVVLFMGSTFEFFLYFVGVLSIGFYWTLEVPRMERLVVSLCPVTRRPQVVSIWHEVENKLGAFVRGQGIAMLVMGGLSAIGYWMIGLPNVLVLAALAGALEAIPIVGPVLFAIPALAVAMSQGVNTALLVLGFCIVLQLFESNVLIPPLMKQSVGVSSVVALFAVLAFGALYGILGALVAIPLTVVIQVVLDRTVINPKPVADQTEALTQPLDVLQAQMQELRQRLRSRLRERESRMQTTDAVAATTDDVADTIEQKLARAVEQVETLLATVAHDEAAVDGQGQQQVITALRGTAEKIEHTLQRFAAVLPNPEDQNKQTAPAVEGTVLAELDAATAQVAQAVSEAGAVVAEAKENSTSDAVAGSSDTQQAPHKNSAGVTA